MGEFLHKQKSLEFYQEFCSIIDQNKEHVWLMEIWKNKNIILIKKDF